MACPLAAWTWMPSELWAGAEDVVGRPGGLTCLWTAADCQLVVRVAACQATAAAKSVEAALR